MELVIEYIGRGSRHSEFHKVSGNQVSIGRGFDNDVILVDPHVCIHHAVVQTNESGEIELHDLGSVNGTYTKKHQQIDDKHIVMSGDEFIIGKTHIRIFRQDHAMAPSIRINQFEKLLNIAARPWTAAAVFSAVMLLSMFLAYSAQVNEINTGRFILTVLATVLAIAVWPVCWSIYARIKKHELRFLAQLTVTLVFVTVLDLVQKGFDWLTFHNGINIGLEISDAAVVVLVVLMLIWINYYLSGFQSAKKRWLYSTGLTILLTGLGYIASTMDSDRFANYPEYFARLYPPSLTVYTAQSVEAYLKDAELVFEKARDNIGD